MKYRVFINGQKDEQGNYVGGELVGTFTSEKQAWLAEREYFKNFKNFITYMVREGEEVFAIIKAAGWYHIVDKATQSHCYGMSPIKEEAIKHKEWCEKYHTLGWYYDF